ncbi:MAG: DUF3179 domain-containing protein [Bacteroidota bacterium]|nr:DUF3179 domain-containing protein [Bacteroidota bacterium]
MKKYFYIGLFGLFLVEVLKGYFLMPMPGSQEQNSLSLVYFLYDKRWIFRIVFFILILAGMKDVFQKRKWVPIVFLLIACAGIYFSDVMMSADRMFHEPNTLAFKSAKESSVNDSSIVMCVVYNGVAKAYPIQFLTFHHQVQDTIAGKAVMVTYCSVCRSGIVFEPVVNGKKETFRLVGMTNYNAMFEDHKTKSWWAQATGECIAGPLKGASLPDFPSSQMTIKKFVELYPNAFIMQPDPEFLAMYDTERVFEQGKITSGIERTDTASWKDKSWVIGVEMDKTSKAYDWNELKAKRIINDDMKSEKVVIALSEDQQSYCAFVRPQDASDFTISHDTLFANGKAYDFTGKNSEDGENLVALKTKQEFWHSWKEFHPNTLK